jgi:hypothetical protein
LSLIIEDSLSWKAHMEQKMSTLNTACFVIWTLKAIMCQKTLRMVYFAYIHLVMSYEIIFWGGNQPIMRKLKKSKRRWSELFQIQQLETHVGNFKKNWKYCPYIHNIFFSITICDKKINIYFPQINRCIVSTKDLVPTYIPL